MGHTTAQYLRVGRHRQEPKMKICLVLAALLAVVIAEPFGYGPGIAFHPGGGTSYRGRTVFGYPRGKRSAEAYGYGGYGGGVARHPYGGSSYVGPTIWGLGRKKRDAEADAYGYGGYGGGVALHPYGGSSYVGPTVWGLGRKKRDADAEAYGGYGFGYDALSGHSFIHRSGVGYWPGGEQRGTRGKRSAGWG